MSAADRRNDQAALPPIAEIETFQLHPRRYAASMKVNRRVLEDARLRTTETGDDFVRNRLTAMLETEIYGEKAEDLTRTISVPYCGTGVTTATEHRGETVRIVDVPARIVFSLSLLALVLVGPTWAIVPALAMLAAAFVGGRWGERTVAHEIEVPYEHYDSSYTVDVRRETFAMYPDADLPVRHPDHRLGQPVQLVEFSARPGIGDPS